MKIGIITFFAANNYGAILQAYALQRKVEEMYGFSECIDYKCPAIEKVHSLRKLELGTGVKKIIKNLIHNVYIWPRIRSFTTFRNIIRHSKGYTQSTIRNANKDYDVFIAGSDQVFNFTLTGDDTTYYLDFVDSSKIKIAYAASMGINLQEKNSIYSKLLQRFDLLSVREKSTAAYINHDLKISCCVVPDPVFLYSGEEWLRLLQINTLSKKSPYILVYALYGSSKLFRSAEKLAKKYSAKLYVITKIIKPNVNADKILRYIGPKDFVELINNAAYVITDSFHGTVFSLIFQKQFYVILPPKAPERIVDLLDFTNLSDRIINELTDKDYKKIDIVEVKKKTEELKVQGVAFLQKIEILNKQKQ